MEEYYMWVKTSFVFVVMLIMGIYAHKIELYITPDGSDANADSIHAPFSSLEKARDTICQSKPNAPVTVYLRQATYYLPNIFSLTVEDAGTKDAAITYQAYPGEEVTTSGSMKIDLTWKPYRDGILQAKTLKGLDIDQLFINGRRRHMARYPNYDANTRPYNVAVEDTFSPSRAANWADPTGGYIHVMHRARRGGYHYRITGKNEHNEISYEWQLKSHLTHKTDNTVLTAISQPVLVAGGWIPLRPDAKSVA